MLKKLALVYLPQSQAVLRQICREVKASLVGGRVQAVVQCCYPVANRSFVVMEKTRSYQRCNLGRLKAAEP